MTDPREVEEFRVKLLAEGEEIKDAGPGTWYCHEAIHSVSIFLNMWDQEVFSHPSILNNPEWFAKAEDILTKIYELYQDIGAEHLIDEEPK